MCKASLLSFVALTLSLQVIAGCDEPRRNTEGTRTQIAASAASAASAPAESLPVQVRVSISLDDQEMGFVIPETQPALIGKSRWAKKLAIVADERTPTRILLRVALVSASAEAADIDLAALSSKAAFSQYLEKGQSVTLTPGETIPVDGLDDPPPREIRVTWLL